jgi:hypothetical protein
MISVVKMAAVLEEYSTEEQRSILRFFCGQKDSVQRIFINICFLFTVGSVCCVKRFTTEWQTFRWWRRCWNGVAEVVVTTFKRLLWFRRTGQAMGQVNQCWWWISNIFIKLLKLLMLTHIGRNIYYGTLPRIMTDSRNKNLARKCVIKE